MAKPPGGDLGSKRFALRACSLGLAVTIPFAGAFIASGVSRVAAG